MRSTALHGARAKGIKARWRAYASCTLYGVRRNARDNLGRAALHIVTVLRNAQAVKVARARVVGGDCIGGRQRRDSSKV
jgi:hypothetical protein